MTHPLIKWNQSNAGGFHPKGKTVHLTAQCSWTVKKKFTKIFLESISSLVSKVVSHWFTAPYGKTWIQ